MTKSFDTKVINREFADTLNIASAMCFDKDLKDKISTMAYVMSNQLASDGKIIAFGNGGSFAQAQHFVAELVGKMVFWRRPIRAHLLGANHSTTTAMLNDGDHTEWIRREVIATVEPYDFVLFFSTSGDSQNLVDACGSIPKFGTVRTGALLGFDPDCRLAGLVDVPILLPQDDIMVQDIEDHNLTRHIQLAHLCILHTLVLLIENTYIGLQPTYQKGRLHD